MIAYVLLGLAALSAVNADCSIDINKDLPNGKSPLFIQNGELLFPVQQGKTGVLELKSNEKLTLACPGNKNQITATKSAVSEASCVSGSKLQVGSKSSDMKSLGCSKSASSSIKVTETSCANGNGTVLEMGFEVDSDWYKMVDLCHQLELQNTLYAQHIIHGASLGAAEVESKRPGFTRGDKQLFVGTNPDNQYKQAVHKAMLEKKLGKTQAAKLMSKTFIARGHLAPDADFIYGSWQWLTYFYANVAPQWQSINAGNWLAVEKLARKKATELDGDLTVYTGTANVLTVDDAKGNPTRLFLEDQSEKMPIPEWFWKVMYNAETQEGIAIVSSNNPMLDTTDNLLCPNICSTDYSVSDLRKGLVYCCTVDSLRKAVPYVPALKVKGVLNGPDSSETLGWAVPIKNKK